MEKKAASAYGKYRHIRNAAWQCLLDCGIDSLPVQISAIAEHFGIGIYAYGPNLDLICRSGLEPLLDAMGFAYADPSGRLMIFFNEKTSRQQIRFTIAHELGHILLGHVGADTPQGRLLNPTVEKLEEAADRFAVRLLAPACVLWAKDAYTAEEIEAVCDLSPEYAEKRAKRMKTLRKKNAWLTSDLEKKLYRQLGLPERPEERRDGG